MEEAKGEDEIATIPLRLERRRLVLDLLHDRTP